MRQYETGREAAESRMENNTDRKRNSRKKQGSLKGSCHHGGMETWILKHFKGKWWKR